MVCNLDFNESNLDDRDKTKFESRTGKWTYWIPCECRYITGRKSTYYRFVSCVRSFRGGDEKVGFTLNEAYVSEHRSTPHDRTKDCGAFWQTYERLSQDPGLRKADNVPGSIHGARIKAGPATKPSLVRFARQLRGLGRRFRLRIL